jgi:two-component system response regulator CssR
MYNIYYVEDDDNIRNLLTKYLENEGYCVTNFSNSKDAIDAINGNVHLWILDIMIEEMNSGYQILKEIRKKYSTPIIFLTAKDEEIDRIYGLEQGSEDYITKPFSPREVVLKINKIINRTYKKTSLLKYKEYIIDSPGRKVFKNDENLNLTIKEFDLLLILIKNINNAIPRSFILNKIWEENYFGSDRVVDDLVRRLRTKMPELDIETIYGYGYRLA